MKRFLEGTTHAAQLQSVGQDGDAVEGALGERAIARRPWRRRTGAGGKRALCPGTGEDSRGGKYLKWRGRVPWKTSPESKRGVRGPPSMQRVAEWRASKGC
ncbi:Hypothetical predicted protein [Podarcis lilfordi]|uniref:Uncharacterized protein n=1 Tax=Podarcis lilfordi TaxID=74358 RepID=A0AA35KT61_9SAUR|nr:Hypothetical predicted protein [Podarcis lilfordi]